MTFYKDQLRFTNSSMDNFVIYDGTDRVEADYKALERAMRIEALKWLGSKAVGAVEARMKLIADLAECIGSVRI